MKFERIVVAAAVVLAIGCSKEEAKESAAKVKQTASNAVEKVHDTFDASTPVAPKEQVDPAQRDRERFDQQWRQLQSFNAQQAAQQAAAQQQAAAPTAQPTPPPAAATDSAAPAAAAAGPAPQIATSGKETFKGVAPDQMNAAPVHLPITGDVRGPSVLRTQVYLDRLDLSVGGLDGRWGKNSAIALYWFQKTHGLPASGDVDATTFTALSQAAGNAAPLQQYQLTEADLKGPFTKLPDTVYEKEKLDCLCYESLQEALAEKFHTTQDFLAMANPGVTFDSATAGTSLWVPNVRQPLTTDRPDIAQVVISVSGNSFNAFDGSGRLVFHAPTTLGSKFDPSPDETVKVVAIAHDPNFHYQPKLFHEVPDSDPEAHLKPGPNSPVGVVWIALSKEHFGIHGTGDPDSIGYASSHGCVRLTNWDALEVSHRISKGVKVEFVDTRKASSQT